MNSNENLLNSVIDNRLNQSHQPTKQKKKTKTKKIAVVLLFILFIALLSGGVYLYIQKEQEINQLKAQVAGSQTNIEYQNILNEVKKLVSIADDENVRIALVDDPELLKKENATFYKDVLLGHYLVIMPNSQRVLIYDKQNQRIVNFSSYSISVDLIDEKEIPDSEKPLTIELRVQIDVSEENIARIKETLESASTNYSIVKVSSTEKTDYTGLTLILLNSEKKPKMSQNIIAHTGTSSVFNQMPDGEASSEADAVIIIGKI